MKAGWYLKNLDCEFNSDVKLLSKAGFPLDRKSSPTFRPAVDAVAHKTPLMVPAACAPELLQHAQVQAKA